MVAIPIHRRLCRIHTSALHILGNVLNRVLEPFRSWRQISGVYEIRRDEASNYTVVWSAWVAKLDAEWQWTAQDGRDLAAR